MHGGCCIFASEGRGSGAGTMTYDSPRRPREVGHRKLAPPAPELLVRAALRPLAPSSLHRGTGVSFPSPLYGDFNARTSVCAAAAGPCASSAAPGSVSSPVEGSAPAASSGCCSRGSGTRRRKRWRRRCVRGQGGGVDLRIVLCGEARKVRIELVRGRRRAGVRRGQRYVR